MGSLWIRVIVVTMISVLVLEEAKWSNGCWDEERTALLHLKSFFNLKMMEEGPDCCEWKWGWVECNVTTRRVTGIYLNVAKNYFNYKLNTSYLFNASIFLPFEDLRTLDLSYIGFAGSVENQGIEKLSKLRHLQNLSLAGNDLFTGSNLTDEIKLLSRMNSLEILDLSRTNMTNNYLSYLGGFSSLRSLTLQGNYLQGTVEIEDFYNLKKLDLSQNGIETLQSSYGSGRLINLQEIDLSYNLFDNNILAELGGCLNLKSLNLRENRLIGSIDVKEKRCFKKLNFLYLEALSTNGNTTLVSLLEAFPSVKTLFLRDNYFLNNTEVNQQLHVLRNVENLILDYTPLPFNFLESIGILTSLKTLSVYGCGLTGTLPTQGWCYLKSLEELSLRRNALGGEITSCLGNLTSLRYLDIAIPSELTEMTALAVFSVAHNNLSGPLPNRKNQFGTFEENSYKGNPLLCGPPLNKSCSEGTPSASSSEEEHGPVDMGYFYISFAVSYGIIFLATVAVLYINPYWRRAWFKFVEDCSTACYFFIVDRLGRLPCFRRNM
ncbi:hypothetical protein GOBAR_DD00076 [Gossypium barbadense]|nr:hypothetical protein GOBAR_DD00076 [Gossypium barbadense]